MDQKSLPFDEDDGSIGHPAPAVHQIKKTKLLTYYHQYPAATEMPESQNAECIYPLVVSRAGKIKNHSVLSVPPW
jgi:hypothetical protein